MKNRPATVEAVGAGEKRQNPNKCEKSYNGFAGQSASPTPLIINVAAVSAAPPDYYRATLDTGELLVAASRQPFLDASRALIGLGYDAGRIAVMRHLGSNIDCFRSTLRRAACLTVAERADEIPRFSRWKALPHRAGSSWTAIAVQGGAP